MRASTVAGLGAVAAGGAAVVGIAMVFERTQRPVLEAKSYVQSIHQAAEGWVASTDRLMAEMLRMPESAARVSEMAEAYVGTRRQP